MKKGLFLTLTLVSISYAQFVDGISVVVNKLPITTYDISKTSKALNVNSKRASDMLIEQKVVESEVKKNGVHVSDFDIDLEIERIAKSQNKSVSELERYLKQKDETLSSLREDIKTRIQKQKLYSSISSKKLQPLDDRELREYYELHKDKYSTASSFNVIKFTAKEKSQLISFLKSGQGDRRIISQTEQTLKSGKIHKNLKKIFMDMREKSLTPILMMQGRYTAYFLLKKSGMKTTSFEQAKPTIFAQAMKGRENKALREYFEKQKAEASIEVVRVTK